jgi:hypothetical protein
MGAFLKKWLQKIFGKSWKTTVAGVFFAAGYAALTAMSGPFTKKDIFIAVGVAVLGVLSKATNVSGMERSPAEAPVGPEVD